MRPALGAGVAVVVGVGVFAIVMQPSTAERVAMGAIFALMAGGTVIAAYLLPRFAEGNRSLRTTVMALSVVSFVIVVFGLLAAGQQMFISSHDLTLLLIVVGFGVGSAVAFAVLVSGPLTGGLARIANTASAVASGDFSRRTGVSRSDEVGELAVAIDEMASALEQAETNRLRADEARGQFFAAVGHDLRTPLASLQAGIEALQDGLADDPDRYLASMSQDTRALGDLVDDVFLLARLESGDLTHVLTDLDLTECADEAVEVLRPLCDERRVNIRLDMDSRVKARADAGGIARVMRNLLDNAIRHSPEGGEIVVRVSNGAAASVEILDEGEGFSPQFVDRAFDRFTRDEVSRSRADGGAGLGLAIARRYVEDFEGSIWVAPGPGGRVGFSLPLRHSDTLGEAADSTAD